MAGITWELFHLTDDRATDASDLTPSGTTAPLSQFLYYYPRKSPRSIMSGSLLDPLRSVQLFADIIALP